MSPRSFYKLFILSFLSLAGAVAVWILTPEYSSGSFYGRPLLPDLIDRINDIEVISIEHGGKTMTFLHNAGGNWSLMEEDGYPADKERIRNMLIGLARLEKIEPKTALPEFYTDLQVEDNTAENSKSYLVTLLNAEGEQIAGLLVGKNISGVTWDGQGYFVRFPNDAQSWLVRGSVDVTGDKHTWLPVRILPLVKGRTASVTIVDGTKTREIVYKRADPSLPLQMTFRSDPYFVISRDFTEGMEKALTSFDFENAVRRPADLEKETPFTSLMLETVDGLTAYISLYLIESQPYAAVSFATSDEAQEPVQKEAEELESLHGQWLYQMSPETISALLPFLSVKKENDSAGKTAKHPVSKKKASPSKKTAK